MIQKGNTTLLQPFSKGLFRTKRTQTEVNGYMRRHQTRSFARTSTTAHTPIKNLLNHTIKNTIKIHKNGYINDHF